MPHMGVSFCGVHYQPGVGDAGYLLEGCLIPVCRCSIEGCLPHLASHQHLQAWASLALAIMWGS